MVILLYCVGSAGKAEGYCIIGVCCFGINDILHSSDSETTVNQGNERGQG
jgi:hypothetical protein